VDRVNEQTSAYYTVSFYDKDGDLEAPASVTYSVTDKASGTVIRADTALVTGQTVLVHLDADDTKMLNEDAGFEVHVLTVIGTYGAKDKVTAAIEFQVDNLVGVDST